MTLLELAFVVHEPLIVIDSVGGKVVFTIPADKSKNFSKYADVEVVDVCSEIVVEKATISNNAHSVIKCLVEHRDLERVRSE